MILLFLLGCSNPYQGQKYLLTKGLYKDCIFTIDFGEYVGSLECKGTSYSKFYIYKDNLFNEFGAVAYEKR